MLRASKPSHKAPVRTERAALVPQTQGIFIGQEARAATGRGPMVLDQGRKKGHVESSYLGSDFVVSKARNIAATCLLKQDHKVVEEMEVPIMVGEGFVCLNKISFVPLSLPFFPCFC